MSYLDLALDAEASSYEELRTVRNERAAGPVRANESDEEPRIERTVAEPSAAASGRSEERTTWLGERMTAVYGLIKDALEAGYLGPAQQVGTDVVQAVEQVAKEAGDVGRACRLLSRDGAGNDVAAAALLAAYEQLCRRLAGAGVDPFRRRAAVALMVARASEGSAQAVVRPDGKVRRAAVRSR